MANIDLTKYGITGSTEIVYNPSYEMLFDEEYTHYKLSAFFKGKTKKECEYLAIPTFYNYRYTDSEGKAVTYQQYLDQVKEQQNMRYAKLKGTDKAFYEQQRLRP